MECFAMVTSLSKDTKNLPPPVAPNHNEIKELKANLIRLQIVIV